MQFAKIVQSSNILRRQLIDYKMRKLIMNWEKYCQYLEDLYLQDHIDIDLLSI